jgi:uncharacterized membrane protein YbaN (DUF454 family)
MPRIVKQYVLLGLGWFFIVLGIAGLFLPVLQGVLFLCIGLILLGQRSKRVRWLILRAGQRWPKFRRALEFSRARAAVWRARLRLRRRYG